MFKKMIAKRIAKKTGKEAKKKASWFAKKEAQIVVTALATIATQKAIQAAAKKYPSFRFFKHKAI